MELGRLDRCKLDGKTRQALPILIWHPKRKQGNTLAKKHTL